MRNARMGLWLLAFIVGAAVPGFCQVIVPPNVSGRTIAADAGTSTFQQAVHSTGNFQASLVVLRNSQMKFSGSGIVSTCGPMTTVYFDLAFGTFGLRAGDLVTFIFTVKHLGTEGNTSSVVVTVLPVVAASTTTTTTPPQQTKAAPSASPERAFALAAARKEEDPV